MSASLRVTAATLLHLLYTEPCLIRRFLTVVSSFCSSMEHQSRLEFTPQRAAVVAVLSVETCSFYITRIPLGQVQIRRFAHLLMVFDSGTRSHSPHTLTAHAVVLQRNTRTQRNEKDKEICAHETGQGRKGK